MQTWSKVGKWTKSFSLVMLLGALPVCAMEKPDDWEEKVNSLFTVIGPDSELSQNTVKLNDCPLANRGEQLAGALSRNSNLSRLELSRTGLKGDQLHLLLQGLINHPTLSTLLLAKNKITDASAASLFRFLLKNKSLGYLDLEDNKLTHKGIGITPEGKISEEVPTLFAAFPTNESLVCLKLAGNYISDIALEAVKSFMLRQAEKSLTLRRAGQQIQAPRHKPLKSLITKYLHSLINRSSYPKAELLLVDKRISEFEPAKIRLKDKEFSKRVTQILRLLAEVDPETQHSLGLRRLLSLSLGMPDSECLDISYGNLLKEEAFPILTQALQGNTILETLIIRGQLLGHDKGIKFLESLKNHPKLGKLSLARAGLQGSTHVFSLIELFPTWSNLKVLCLFGNDLCDQGALAIGQWLEQNPPLLSLGLNDTKIGPEGVGCLAEALLCNTILTELLLSGNPMGDKGAISFARGLKGNKGLTVLDLSKNYIGDVGAKALAEVLPHHPMLKYLYLHKNLIEEEGASAFLEACFEGGSQTKVSLGGNPISKDVIDLGLVDNHFALEEMRGLLSNLPKAVREEERELPSYWEVALDEEEEEASLKEDEEGRVEVVSNSESPKGKEKMDSPELQRSPSPTLVATKQENKLGNLWGLLSSSSSSQPIPRHNESLEDRQTISLSELAQDYSKLPSSIKNIFSLEECLGVAQNDPKIKKLDFSHQALGSKGLEILGKALKLNSRIETLNLTHVNMRNGDALKLIAFLGGNPRLMELLVGENPLSDDGVIYLLRDLAHKDLAFLDLHKLGTVKLRAIQTLADHLSKGARIRALDLSDNRLGIQEAQELASGLQGECLLEELSLSQTDLRDAEVKSLADQLKHNRSLKILYLEGNKITDIGAGYLVDALAYNTDLEALFLQGNNLTNDSAKNFLNLFKNQKNRTLYTLSLPDEGIDRENVGKLAIFLGQNKLSATLRE